MPVNAKVAEAYIDLVARTSSLEKSMGDARGMVRRWSRETASEMHEARGAIVLVGEQFGVHIPRHLQAFIAELPGVSAAMSAAFNSVAVIALIGVIVEAGKKIAEFAQKNEEAASKLKASQEEFGLTVEKTYGSFQEKLLQAGIKADELRGDHLDALHKELKLIDMQGFNQLESAFKAVENAALHTFDNIKSSWISTVAQMSFSQASGFKGSLERFGQEYSSLLALQRGPEAQELLNETQKREEQNRADLVAIRAKGIRSWASAGLVDNDTNAIMERLRARGITNYSDQTFDAATQATQALEAWQNIAAQQRTDTEDAKKNAIGEYASKRVQYLEEELKQQKAGAGFSQVDEMYFWQQHLKDFDREKDSKQYAEVEERMQAVAAKLYPDFWGAGKLAILKKSMKLDAESVPPDYTLASKGDQQLEAANAKLEQSQSRINAEWEAAQDKIKLMTGAMTPLEAAMSAAERNTKSYQTQIEALKNELAKLHAFDDLANALGGDKELQAKEAQAKTQLNELENKARIQQLVDAQEVFAQTWKGMVDSLFDEVLKRSQDTAAEIRRISAQFLEGTNSELAKAATGQRFDFSHPFRQVSESLAKTAFEKVEGGEIGVLKNTSLGKALGLDHFKFGERGASESNPLFVKLAGQGAGAFAGSKIASYLGIDGSQSVSGAVSGAADGASSSGVIGGLSTAFIRGLMGYAGGGDVNAGVPIRVGELGEEIFTPRVPGRIVPNHRVAGGGDIHVHVDARGSSDPAAVEATVHRAMSGYLGRVGEITRAAHADHNSRVPASKRR